MYTIPFLENKFGGCVISKTIIYIVNHPILYKAQIKWSSKDIIHKNNALRIFLLLQVIIKGDFSLCVLLLYQIQFGVGNFFCPNQSTLLFFFIIYSNAQLFDKLADFNFHTLQQQNYLITDILEVVQNKNVLSTSLIQMLHYITTQIDYQHNFYIIFV